MFHKRLFMQKVASLRVFFYEVFNEYFDSLSMRVLHISKNELLSLILIHRRDILFHEKKSKKDTFLFSS